MFRRFAIVAAALVVACSDSSSPFEPGTDEEGVASVSSALTASQRILSFDGPIGAQNADWRALNGAATSSAVRVEGTASLSLSGSTNASAVSAPLSSLGNLNTTAGIDVNLPTSLAGQSWLGQIALFFNAPSVGVYNQYAGPVVLNAPLGSFQHYNVPIPPYVVSALSGKSYSDLTVTVQLNVPITSGAVLIDRLTLSPGNSGGTGGTSGAGGSGGNAGRGGTAGAGGNAGRGGTAGAGGSAGRGGTAGAGGNAGRGGTVGAGGSASGGAAGNAGSAGSAGSGLSFELSIRTPKGVKPADVVVGMESCLEAADGVRFIKEGAASTHTSLSNIATLGAPSYFGVQSELQNLWTGTGTDLRNRAHVYGFIQSSSRIGKQIDTIVDGPVTENAVLTPYEVQSWTVTYPATSLGTVSLEPNQSRSPAPGSRYDDYFVKSNATLHLEPGTYYFNNLVIEPSARLEVQNATGSVQVYVRQGFILRGVLAESQAKANTLFALASRADEPMAVFDIESPFHGLVVAPHGFINLGTTNTGHVGSFYGAGFRANPWTPIYQRPTDPNYITSIRCHDGTRDGDESDVDCGGSCGPCAPGGGCSQASDCGSGMACGFSNGACFGGARAKRVCWPARCEDGIDPEAGECGQANSPCGQNCACVTSCDSSRSNTCPAGEQCVKGMGGPFGASTPDVCLDPSCPSNSPTLCGGDGTLCGPCICTPDCSHATCASPGDGCGGLCPAVCPIGGSGSGGPNCTTDLTCPAGAVCLTNQDGSRTCRPAECATATLVPPLCGSPTAPCGTQCPTCVAACDGSVCGADPMCGTSCGTCSGDTHCDATGQCVSTPPETRPTVPDGNGGQKPVAPLPHVDASAVGAVPGAFSVSEAGTAEYTVPIEVPPGRAGLEPSLSLRYAGTRVNGDLGVGWTLEGLSKITRCPHTYAVDGYAGPITNTVTDALCLDGKRLRNVGGAATPTIGKPAEYRTLIDSFAKVVGYQTDDEVGVQLPPFASILRVIRGLQGADYFKVWTKDGRILTYGGAADSLIMSRNGVRNTWLLTRVEDRAGNNIIITYENAAAQLAPDTGLSLVRPKLITYTGHGATAGNREVRFSYETRPDTNVRYFQGAVGWLVQERLARVSTFVRGAPVKNYRLVYSEQNTSQIEKVFECQGDSDSRCKAPTTFTYAAESGFDLGFSPVKAEAAVQLDVDGNGIPDFLETEVTVNGVAARPEYKAAEIGADIAVGIATSFMTFGTGLAVTAGYTVVKIVALGLLAEDPKITYKSNLWLGNGGRTDKSYAVWIQDVKGIPCQGKQIVFYDYDRDGKDDAIGVCNDNRVYVARSDGSGNFQPFPDSKPVATLPVVWIPFTDGKVASRGPAPVFMDLDGDSLEDIVDCTDPKTLEVRRRLSPAGGFATPVAVSGSSSGYCGEPRHVT